MKKIKQFLKNFLKKIEEQNNQSFGTGRLDCCDLNKSPNVNKKTVNKNK
ncbi:LDCC motif putative metal-binding protein [Gottschalkia acidurici]|nr:LDCC motif putative metal-binding protein [Gottschalkia acidurici]